MVALANTAPLGQIDGASCSRVSLVDEVLNGCALEDEVALLPIAIFAT